MSVRIVAIAILVVAVAGTAGTAIAIGTSGVTDAAAADADSDIAGQVAHYLSPSEIDRNVAGEELSGETPPDRTDSEEQHWEKTGVRERVGPRGSSQNVPFLPNSTESVVEDTSGDGYPDRLLEDASPLASHDPDPDRRNVFVEVDYMEGCDPQPAVEQTIEAFAEAPVENPDGSTGIDLHVTIGEEIPRAALVTPTESQLQTPSAVDYREQTFQRDGLGYHYMVFVHNAGPIDGFRHDGDADISVVECDSGDTFMHELGHTLGIDSSVPVVDAHDVPHDKYPSTMNYDRPDDHFDFSTGDASGIDHDDWGVIEESMSDNVPPVDTLKRSYFDGTGVLVTEHSYPETSSGADEGAAPTDADATDASSSDDERRDDCDSDTAGDDRDE